MTKLPLKILIVEDEEEYRSIAHLILSEAGYEVQEAVDGNKALSILEQYLPNLILSDIQMPGMDGFELLRRLKENQSYSSIPFVFLTGFTDKMNVREGMQHGADDYLTKPFTAEELLNCVQARLVKYRSIEKYYEERIDEIRTSIGLMLPHELRTPLNAILGYSQLLETEKDLPGEEVQKAGQKILKAGKRLQRILENIIFFTNLQFLKTDNDKVKDLQSEETPSLGIVARSVINSNKIPGGRTAEITLSACDVAVQVSSEYLQKILEEVIDNAVKFSEPGTPILIDCTEKGDEAVIMVHDEGRGMDVKEIEIVTGYLQFNRKLFEQQGAGLGLTIAKMLAEIHGGTLTIESEKNKGTVVSIHLKKIAKR